MSYCQSCGTALSGDGIVCSSCAAATPGGSDAAMRPVQASSGLQPNAAGALTYLAGFITGIIFLLIDPYKADRFVRFHAFQSIFFNVAWIGMWVAWVIVGLLLSALTKGIFFFIQLPLDVMLMAGGFGLWVYLMYSASQGKTPRLPVIGALAAKQAGFAYVEATR